MTIFPGSIYGSMGRLGVGKQTSAAVPWWLSGGISAANCIAAYQPKGAADLAASYVNLANPGTYNAAPGVAPTWDAVNGWVFNGASQYLVSGIIAAAGYSMIVQFSGVVENKVNKLCGCNAPGSKSRFLISTNINLNNITYQYGHDAKLVIPSTASGCLAITPAAGYRNGISETTFSGLWTGTGIEIHIGATKEDAGVIYGQSNIQALAIYNTTLTAPQVAALTAAMTAL